ncbi:DUF4760 domain-containing protein [Agromyces arachidis]|uniref:DUF4760 domain-containing protein n=1 Tax=Agromyces arachidis TaxID=766966 RepID=UPI004057B235
MGDAESIKRMSDRRPDRFVLVSRALSLYNTLAIYAHRGYLDRDLAFGRWADRVREDWPRIELFLRWRRAHGGGDAMWNHLVWFAEKSGAEVGADLRLGPGWDRRVRTRRRRRPARSAGRDDRSRPPETTVL